ncbi:MAG: DNA-processing protein DprA [Paludibacteraceae bacterium]|nr:DNA-processing protein DprA [Paludibacteraceae bacterium]
MDTELYYELALTQIETVGLVKAHLLMETFGTAKAIFDASPSDLSMLGASGNALADRDIRSEAFASAEREIDFIESKGITAITYISTSYPERLRECPDAPIVLFQLGFCPLNSQKMVAMVGTRHATEYGRQLARTFVEQLSAIDKGIVVVSGLAYGIDISCHRAALDFGMPTIAVVAHGMDRIYPPLHRNDAARMINSGGAVLSEFFSGTQPIASNFLQRNRIVAGLCDAVIVVESDARGGSLSTARIASEYNREVFAFPGRIGDKFSTGCNRLISDDRARIVLSADDFMTKMNWMPEKTAAKQPELPFDAVMPLTDNQKAIFDILRTGPKQINELAALSSLTPAEISAAITEMLLSDVIISLPGDMYDIPLKASSV